MSSRMDKIKPFVGALSVSHLNMAVWPCATVIDCGKTLKVGLLVSSFGTTRTKQMWKIK